MPPAQCAALPVVGARLMSGYGDVRPNSVHHGLDLKAPEGADVYAIAPGVVRVVAYQGELDGYGQTVVIDHGPWLTLSAHLLSMAVHEGDVVQAGQRIGSVGRTAGTFTDPERQFERERAHLHFEFLDRWPVRKGGEGRLDPAPILAELGIVTPDGAPIFRACDGPQKVVRQRRAAAGGGALLVLVLAYAAHKRGWL